MCTYALEQLQVTVRIENGTHAVRPQTRERACRLEIQSVMLEFSPGFVNHCLFNLLSC